MSSAKSIKRKAASDGARTAAKKPSKPKGMVELVEGHILTDLTKKRWRLGRLIGWGGFGALYLGRLYLTELMQLNDHIGASLEDPIKFNILKSSLIIIIMIIIIIIIVIIIC